MLDLRLAPIKSSNCDSRPEGGNVFLEHKYGENVKILNNTFISSLLTPFSTETITQPALSQNIKKLYEHIFAVALENELRRENTSVATRMAALHPKVPLEANIFSRSQKAVCVDLARAGMVPSQVGYELLNLVLNPDNVRQDHVWASRVVNENSEVIGTTLDGSKIGGPVEDACVFFPDPMGATGGTLKSVIEYYKEKVEGTARKYIGLHLIVTPEFLKRTSDIKDLVIYAGRLDRGLSPDDVLSKIPGEDWDNEKGLNENSYIVPGAGGVGELLNNSYV